MRGMQDAAVGQQWYKIASEKSTISNVVIRGDAEGATAVKI